MGVDAARSVVMVPDYRRNPYLTLLGDALAQHGFTVEYRSDLVELLQHDQPIPDVVHLHWERYRTVADKRSVALRRSIRLIASVGALRRKGVRVVWTVHNLRDHEAPHPIIEHLAQLALARLVHAIVVHHPDATKVTRRWLRIPANRLHVMLPGPYPVATHLDRRQAREALELPSDGIVLAAVGLIRRYKRVPELIEAVRRLDDRFSLIVAGRPWDGEAERLENARRGDPRVRMWLTEQSDEEMSVLLTAADAFVLASEEQFSSGSVILAMGHGCAVISGRSDHVRFLAGEEGARFFPQGSAVPAMTAVLASLDDEQLRAMGEHNRSRARSFSWDCAARSLVEIYGLHDP